MVELEWYEIQEYTDSTADAVFVEQGKAYLAICTWEILGHGQVRAILLPIHDEAGNRVAAPADWRERIV